mgnify:FL=1
MFLIILGFLLILIFGVIANNNLMLQKFKTTARIIGAGLIVLGVLTSCIKQVDAGEIGIKVLFGNVQNDILGSGLHFVNPL